MDCNSYDINDIRRWGIWDLKAMFGTLNENMKPQHGETILSLHYCNW